MKTETENATLKEWKDYIQIYGSIGVLNLPSALLKTMDAKLEGRIYSYLKKTPFTSNLSMTLCRALPIHIINKIFTFPRLHAIAAVCLFLIHYDIDKYKKNPPIVKLLHAVAMAFFFDLISSKNIVSLQSCVNLGLLIGYFHVASIIENSKKLE